MGASRIPELKKNLDAVTHSIYHLQNSILEAKRNPTISKPVKMGITGIEDNILRSLTELAILTDKVTWAKDSDVETLMIKIETVKSNMENEIKKIVPVLGQAIFDITIKKKKSENDTKLHTNLSFILKPFFSTPQASSRSTSGFTSPIIETKAKEVIKSVSKETRLLTERIYKAKDPFRGIGPGQFQSLFEPELKVEKANLEWLRNNLVNYSGKDKAKIEPEIKKIDTLIKDFNELLANYKIYQNVMENKGHESPEIEAAARNDLITKYATISVNYSAALDRIETMKGGLFKSHIDKYESILHGTKRNQHELDFIKSEGTLEPINLKKGSFARRDYSGPSSK
jgi:hypothetical protein